MTEEQKQEQTPEPETKSSSKMFFKMHLGVILIILGVGAIWTWRTDLLVVIRGMLGGILLLAGIIALAIAKE
jgi:hypothetical protein